MKSLKITRFELVLFAAFFIFAAWLMWHTFQYHDHTFYITAKLWSDFAAHIPLIRSFSWGHNWPPEYPLFPNEPIRYHFLFYFLVGNLEKLGLPFDWALNLPSVVGFSGLMTMLYLLGKLIFKSRLTGFLTVILFLFNSSLAFLKFFKTHTFREIFTNPTFPVFGPWDSQIISAFWNLNIYTNQRHLAPAFFLILLIVYLVLKNKKLALKKIFFLALIIGFLPFFHKVALTITGLILAGVFVLFPVKRRGLVLLAGLSFLLVTPQLYLQITAANSPITFHPGYLIEPPLTLVKFFSYWWQNLGLSLFFIPLGFLLAPKTGKKLFLSIIPIFLVGYLFQFSPEVAANHKFFNFFVIIGNLFTAYALTRLFSRSFPISLIALISLISLTFSGLIDFFPIKNDVFYQIADAPKNPEILWIKNNTPPNAIFLNSSFLYHPASLAGRKIFYGWPYFTWGIGYQIDQRAIIIKKIHEGKSKEIVCSELINNKINYVILEETDKNVWPAQINSEFFSRNFHLAYSSPNKLFIIYNVDDNCPR